MVGIGIFKQFKLFVSSIGWKLFIWGMGTTEEEYWEQVYEQEKAIREEYEDYDEDEDQDDDWN